MFLEYYYLLSIIYNNFSVIFIFMANKHLNKTLRIELKGNSIFTGKLKVHDPFMKSVLEQDI